MNPTTRDLERLAQALALGEGFQLLVAVSASHEALTSALDICAARFVELRGEHLRVHRIDVYAEHQPPWTAVTPGQLEERVAKQLLRGGQARDPRLLVVDATRSRRSDERAWSALFARLNERRNRLMDSLRSGLLLALPEDLRDLLARGARDLWSVRTVIVELPGPRSPAPVPAVDVQQWRMSTLTENSLVPTVAPIGWLDTEEVYVDLGVRLLRDRSSDADYEASFSEAAENNRRMLLVGPPGSGKTTLLRALANRLALHAPGESAARLPVVMSLGRTGGTDFDELLEASERTEDGHDSGWLRHALTSGGEHLWILCDGLDEISGAAARERLARALERWSRVASRARWLVTTRPVPETSIFFDWTVAETLPLDPERAEALVARLGMERDATPLVRWLFERPSLQRLAQNPLTLSVTAVLWQTGQGFIPGEVELQYDRLVNELLGRDVQRRFVSGAARSAAELIALHERVAFDAIQRGQDVLEALPAELHSGSPLIVHTEGGPRFIHRSFLDFLAARWVIRHDVEVLAQHLTDPDWRQVCCYAMGLLAYLNPPRAEATLHVLLQTADSVVDHAERVVALSTVLDALRAARDYRTIRRFSELRDSARQVVEGVIAEAPTDSSESKRLRAQLEELE